MGTAPSIVWTNEWDHSRRLALQNHSVHVFSVRLGPLLWTYWSRNCKYHCRLASFDYHDAEEMVLSIDINIDMPSERPHTGRPFSKGVNPGTNLTWLKEASLAKLSSGDCFRWEIEQNSASGLAQRFEAESESPRARGISSSASSELSMIDFETELSSSVEDDRDKFRTAV